MKSSRTNIENTQANGSAPTLALLDLRAWAPRLIPSAFWSSSDARRSSISSDAARLILALGLYVKAGGCQQEEAPPPWA